MIAASAQRTLLERTTTETRPLPQTADAGWPVDPSVERDALGASVAFLPADVEQAGRNLKFLARNFSLEDFSVGEHRTIFSTLCDFHEDGLLIVDTNLLKARLREAEKIDESFAALIDDIDFGVVRAVPMVERLRVLRPLAARREALRAAEELIAAANSRHIRIGPALHAVIERLQYVFNELAAVMGDGL